MIDRVIHSNRKTLGLEITSHGEVILRVPQKVREREVERFLQRSKHWIQKHKQIAIKRKQETLTLDFTHGTYLPYLGVSYPLRIIDQKRPKIAFVGHFMLGKAHQGKGRAVFMQWAKKEAKKVCEIRARIYAKKAKREFVNIRITSAEKRWGSCSGDSLNFAWRLVLAPLWIIDYIVAHEVAHLIHKNHGKRFWVKVETLYPNYKEAERWLKNHGHILNV